MGEGRNLFWSHAVVNRTKISNCLFSLRSFPPILSFPSRQTLGLNCVGQKFCGTEKVKAAARLIESSSNIPSGFKSIRQTNLSREGGKYQGVLE